jgi:magnesium transporter
MSMFLLGHDGAHHAPVDRATVESSLEGGKFFWLDVHRPDEEEYAILRDVFRFHPLALEDARHFGQRAKIETYDDYAFIVFYGAAPPPDVDSLVEVHCFYSERYLVTVRKDESQANEDLRARYERRSAPAEKPIAVLYRLLDSLTDSFFPVLADLDERIDEIQDAMIAAPREEQMQEIFAMRRQLVNLRRAVTPQRDLLGQMLTRGHALPGLDEEAERYFRNVYDHLIRVSDLIDSYRDLLTGAMDVYLSTVSNRLNVVIQRLTVIATLALPLIVITGFFGQNFGFLVRHISGWPAFVAYGVAAPLALFVALVVYLKRRDLA